MLQPRERSRTKWRRKFRGGPWLVTHRPSATHPHQVSARVLLTVEHSSSLAMAAQGQLEPSPNFTASCCMSVTAGDLGSDHERQALAGIGAGVSTVLAASNTQVIRTEAEPHSVQHLLRACALTEHCCKKSFSQTPGWGRRLCHFRASEPPWVSVSVLCSNVGW